MKYCLGVDVSGTKTHALIADEQGVAVGFGEAGPGNHEVVGYEGLAGALRECTQRLWDKPDFGANKFQQVDLALPVMIGLPKSKARSTPLTWWDWMQAWRL